MTGAGRTTVQGPRIVDFSTHMSGPLATHLLAELGADVIKIESPGVGDGNRGLAPRTGSGLGTYHLALNGGARSLAVSTRSAAWPEVVAAAARWADVVVVGSRPADSRRRGLDFESLHAVNPRLVYCQVSGFGTRGPWRDHTAHGQTIDAFAGGVPLTWTDGEPGTPAGWRSAGAPLGGVFAALGVLAGLRRRDHGGGGVHIDVSLWSAALWWNWRDTVALANLGHPATEYDALGSRYRTYETADHRAVLVCPIERKFWERFCTLAGLPEEFRARGDWTASGMHFGDPDDSAESRAIATAVRARPLAHWVDELGAAGIPFAPVLTLDEALGSEHAAAEGALRRFTVRGGDAWAPRVPVRITDPADPTAEVDLRPPPELGAHDAEILGELGVEHLAQSLLADDTAESVRG